MAALDAILLAQCINTATDIRQCPNPRCDYLFVHDPKHVETVACIKCQERYCAGCLILHDRTVNCDDAKAEKEASLTGDDALKAYQIKKSEELVREQTKPCPHCRNDIDKYDGCPYVACVKCHKVMCWTCGQKWWETQHKEDSHYHCPYPDVAARLAEERRRPEEVRRKQEAEERARAEAQRTSSSRACGSSSYCCARIASYACRR